MTDILGHHIEALLEFRGGREGGGCLEIRRGGRGPLFSMRYPGNPRFWDRPGGTTNVDRNERLATLAFVMIQTHIPKLANFASCMPDDHEAKIS